MKSEFRTRCLMAIVLFVSLVPVSALWGSGDRVLAGAQAVQEGGAVEAAPMAITATVEVPVSQSSDDAEEQPNGDVLTGNNDLELGEDVGPQVVGLRFAYVPVPKGATIESAYIEFTADEDGDKVTNLTFRGQAIDSAPTFHDDPYDVSLRDKTSASVSWNNVSPWAAEGKYNTPSLVSIVQEVVNRGGWAPSNAMAFIISGTGTRTAYSWDGADSLEPRDMSKVAKLVITFTGQATCYSLATSVSPGGTGTVTKSPAPNCTGGKYVEGTRVELTATPTAVDYGFSNWTGSVTGSENPTYLIMNGDKAVTANFSQQTCHTLITTVNPPLDPSIARVDVNPLPNCGGGKYVLYTQVQLKARVASGSGYEFTNWSGDAIGTANPTKVTMDRDKTVTANFSTGSGCYLLTLSVDPAGAGSVSASPPPNCSGTGYNPGTTVQLTANPASGFTFLRWANDASGTTSPTTITMDGHKSVIAIFEGSAGCYTLTTSVAPPGSGNIVANPAPNCEGNKYTAGAQVKLTAQPATGYSFFRWTGDATGAANPITVTMTRDKAVRANFFKPDHRILLPVAQRNR